MAYFGVEITNPSEIVELAKNLSLIQKALGQAVQKILSGKDVGDQVDYLNGEIERFEKSIRKCKALSPILIDQAVMLRQGIKTYKQSLGLMTEISQRQTQFENLVVRNYN
jgi:hypothetical protein